MNKRFDFSKIDEALPTAEKMQERDRMTDALENNYEAVRILNANVEKLENRLSEALPKMDGTISSLREASTVSISEEARKTLEREGEKICRKMADRMESECTRLAGRLSANDRMLISATAFWCMILTVIILSAFFACIIAANSYLFQNALLWKMASCFGGLWILCMIITVFVCRKLECSN